MCVILISLKNRHCYTFSVVPTNPTYSASETQQRFCSFWADVCGSSLEGSNIDLNGFSPSFKINFFAKHLKNFLCYYPRIAVAHCRFEIVSALPKALEAK